MRNPLHKNPLCLTPFFPLKHKKRPQSLKIRPTLTDVADQKEGKKERKTVKMISVFSDNPSLPLPYNDGFTFYLLYLFFMCFCSILSCMNFLGRPKCCVQMSEMPTESHLKA